MQPDPARRVAITGVGAWSAYGRGVAPILAAFDTGQRALRAPRRMGDVRLLRSVPTIEAEGWDSATDPDPWQWASRQAIATARDATNAAHIDYARRRIAVINGTTHGSNETINHLRARRAGVPRPGTLSVDPAAVTRQIARAIGADGPNVTINAACSSGLHSIGRAAALVESGEVDCAVAGGIDIVSALTYLGFDSLRALAAGGCRPLDRRRDGLTLGDGAAYFVLENEAVARRRGILPLGFVAGYAAGADGYHSTAPDPQGLDAQRIIEQALSGVDARTLRVVAAHGTGTPANDGVEIDVIGRVVDRLDVSGPVFVFALKSWLGHTLGAAGALEAAITLACMRRRVIPATWGLTEPVPHHTRMVLPQASLALTGPGDLALCNAFGFGGSIASLCLQTTEQPI